MSKLQEENASLKLENAQLKFELSKVQKDNRVLQIQLRNVRESREILETQIAELLGEVEKSPKTLAQIAASKNITEAPILTGPEVLPVIKRVHFEEEEEVLKSVKPYENVPESLKDEEEEEESHGISGKFENYDFTSSWNRFISISKSHAGYVTLKNNHKEKSQCLDDFIFVRTVDGNLTVPPTPLPLGVVIPPNEEFTIYADHPEAREVPGKSHIFHRIPTFGTGKVTENRLLDEFGKDTANYVLCEFH